MIKLVDQSEILMPVVAAFEAKTHFSQLLDQVQRGEEIIITRYGEPVAKLVSAHAVTGRQQVAQLIAETRKSRKGQDRGRKRGTS
ncbi:MAG: type II toxin-antitoxin system Phd/YefM family antitoxin, partial [Gammaproteobacteria bacterium]